MSEGANQFVQFCKTVLHVKDVTKDAIDRANAEDVGRLMQVLAVHTKCWMPTDVQKRKQLIWMYINQGVVYPTGTTLRNVHSVVPVSAIPWKGPIPAVNRTNNELLNHIISVALKGSSFEKRLLTTVETLWTVHALEIPRVTQIPVRLPEIHMKNPSARLVADLFYPDGAPLRTSMTIAVGKERLNVVSPSQQQRTPSSLCPYSRSLVIQVDPNRIKTYGQTWSVSVNTTEKRVVLILRIVRPFTIEELIQRVVVRANFETRVPDPSTTVLCTFQRFTTRCPLGFCRMQYPARGTLCTHDSFFDLKTYLTYSIQRGAFVCPLCETWLPPADLEMCDPFYRALVRNPKTDSFIFERGAFTPAPEPRHNRRAPVQPENLPPAKKACIINIE